VIERGGADGNRTKARNKTGAFRCHRIGRRSEGVRLCEFRETFGGGGGMRSGMGRIGIANGFWALCTVYEEYRPSNSWLSCPWNLTPFHDV
jgi:hypothetical protein